MGVFLNWEQFAPPLPHPSPGHWTMSGYICVVTNGRRSATDTSEVSDAQDSARPPPVPKHRITQSELSAVLRLRSLASGNNRARRYSRPSPRRLTMTMCPPPWGEAVLHGERTFFSSQVLHLENVKDGPFGFQTVTSDVNKLRSFYSLKLIKRLYVDKSLNPSTVSGSEQLARVSCLSGVTRSHG